MGRDLCLILYRTIGIKVTSFQRVSVERKLNKDEISDNALSP